MRRIKGVLSFLVIVLMLSTLVACGSSDKEEAKSAEGDQITLRFWDMVWGDTEYASEAGKLAKTYSDTVPNVTVEYQSVPWQNRYETFSVSVAAGEAPDVSTGGGYQQHQFAAVGAILPIDSIIDEWREEGKLDDFPAGMVDFFKDANGVQIGIPFNIDPRGIIYRKDLFEEKGLEIPTSWDELYDVAVALTDPSNGMYGMVFPASDSAANVAFFTWLVANGGGIWSEDGKSPDWNNKENVQTLDFIAKMNKAHVFPEGLASYTNADAQKMFLQGNAAMIVNSVGFGSQIQRLNDGFSSNVALMPMPQGPSAKKPALATAINAYMVYSQTKHPEEAKAFIKWWSENNLVLWTGPAKCGSPPARLSFLNDPSFVNMPENPLISQMIDIWIPDVESTMFPAKNANLPQNTFDAERWWRDLAQAVLIGKKSSETILENKQLAAVELIEDLGL